MSGIVRALPLCGCLHAHFNSTSLYTTKIYIFFRWGIQERGLLIGLDARRWRRRCWAYNKKVSWSLFWACQRHTSHRNLRLCCPINNREREKSPFCIPLWMCVSRARVTNQTTKMSSCERVEKVCRTRKKCLMGPRRALICESSIYGSTKVSSTPKRIYHTHRELEDKLLLKTSFSDSWMEE